MVYLNVSPTYPSKKVTVSVLAILVSCKLIEVEELATSKAISATTGPIKYVLMTNFEQLSYTQYLSFQILITYRPCAVVLQSLIYLKLESLLRSKSGLYVVQ